MGYEIERKFLVDTGGIDWKRAASKRRMVQGYLLNEAGRNVRIRIDEDRAYLTVKGAAEGIRRLEFEYEIPPEDAREMLSLTDGRLIEKQRFFFDVGGKRWEVDVFEGENRGLVVAEIELRSEEESFERPDWVREEVTSDPRYLNARLLQAPYRTWS